MLALFQHLGVKTRGQLTNTWKGTALPPLPSQTRRAVPRNGGPNPFMIGARGLPSTAAWLGKLYFREVQTRPQKGELCWQSGSRPWESRHI
eukprot:3558916-Pyramimonas_sp.AAC.1